MDGSPGLVVMEEDSRSRVFWFECQHQYWTDIFHIKLLTKIYCLLEKDQKNWKETGNGTFKKFYCGRFYYAPIVAPYDLQCFIIWPPITMIQNGGASYSCLRLGSGCGSVGRAVASDTRGPRFDSSHWQKFIFILNICSLSTVYWKDENNEKEAENGPFIKRCSRLLIIMEQVNITTMDRNCGKSHTGGVGFYKKLFRGRPKNYWTVLLSNKKEIGEGNVNRYSQSSPL